MSFDLSRIRFDARQDFLGVVMQQGRVQLDADWNEWAAQLARRLQAGTLDTFSGSVVPRTTPEGFRILANAGALSIGVGRIYVDGRLAENHGGTPDVWDARLAETAGTTPLDYFAQPYYPDPPALPEAGQHLVYVDVWQRDVTALQQPGLIEQAVGVDTTGRLQTVWQVKLLADVGNATCASDDEDVPGWTDLIAPSAGRLTTATGEPDFEPNPCEVPPAAGYRGLENQLYRVEVHTGGDFGTATFKWSRDNATVAARVTHINPARDRITVDSIGRDDILRFNDGDWVEVSDDWLELKNLPGELRRIRLAGGVDETARTLEFESALPAGLFPANAQQATDAGRNTRVRRWDQGGPVRREDGTEIQNLDSTGAGGILIPAAGTQVFLEHGILVDFSLSPAAGTFRSGDYWVFAARSNDASIELLDHAPPRGIHHHYARLAMVSFPDTETDCRTLWPPESAAGGCDCSVCVTAEGHNSGTATLQQAIDRVKDGGTICLGIGRYDIGAPLDVIAARSLRIRGQGWATLLIGREPGSVVRIADGTGVALENLSVIGSADRAGTTAMIEATNTVDLRAEHVNVLGLAAGDGRSVAIGLAGNLLGARIHDCALVAHQGVARIAARDREHLLSAELTLDDNLFFCSQRALSLDGICLHFGTTRVSGNLMLNGDQHAIVATGAVLSGSSLKIADNVIYTTGGGILAGVAGLTIEGNEISGLEGQTDERPDGERGADGIVITDGLFPSAIDNVRIVANRLRLLRGNAITLSRPLVSARIAENRIRSIGMGAIVMDRDASAESLVIFANNCRGLGLATSKDKSSFAAVQLIRVERCDVSDNTIADVALEGVAAAAIDGLFAAAIGQLRVNANRIHTIGPERSGGELSAVHVLLPCDRIVVSANRLDRVGDADRRVAPAPWRALHIAPGAASDVRRSAPAHYYSSNNELAFLMTLTAVHIRAARPGDAAIQDNQLRAVETMVALNLCVGLDHCLFSGNHCDSSSSRTERAQLGEIAARTINASNNRLIGRGDSPTLFLRPDRKLAIVIGNTSTGRIEVDGAPLPSDLLLTNLIGV